MLLLLKGRLSRWGTLSLTLVDFGVLPVCALLGLAVG